jgi:hypothetical protein
MNGAPQDATSALFSLQQAVHGAHSLTDLGFTIVNETHQLLDYTQAALLVEGQRGHYQVSQLSNLPVVDRSAPFVQWVERVTAKHLAGLKAPLALTANDLTADLAGGWDDMAPAHGLLVPLRAPNGELPGVLWLARDVTWDTAALPALGHLADSYGLALRVQLLSSRGSWVKKILPRGALGYGLLGLLLATLLIPVRLTALAPTAVAARSPVLVTAPLNGVIEEVHVESNQAVTPGTLLATYDKTTLNSRFEVANSALAVASAAYRTGQQAAFSDPREKERLAELKAQAELRQAEREFARQQLSRADLRAQQAGIVIIDNPDDWRGRPVDVGERILALADPASVEVNVQLPVKDALLIRPGAEVRVFLDAAPLDPIDARVVRAAFDPALTPEGVMAFEVIADFVDPDVSPRIGLRGVAKLYGERVSLFYLVFRRPITAARQWLGW